MKKLTLITGLVAFGMSAGAQTLQEANKKVDDERYSEARTDFQNLVKANATSTENAFYFGNLYVKLEKIDSAMYWWKKSSEANIADKLSTLGNYKSMYFSGDTATASNGFCTVLKATKNKNVTSLIRISEAYATSGKWANLKLAESYARKALVLEPNNIEALLLLGDILKMNGGTSATAPVEQYNKILMINPNAVNVIVRKAKIYQDVNNFKLANEEFIKAETIDPKYLPAYRYHAWLNVRFSYYDKACELWEKYISLNPSEDAKYGYVVALNGAKRYKESLALINELEKAKPNDFFLMRYKSLALLETNTEKDAAKFKEALSYSDKFFMTAPKDKIIIEDYRNRANIYTKMANDSMAVIELNAAAKFAPEKRGEVLPDLISATVRMKKYDAAIPLLNEKIALGKPAPSDYLDLGKAYYLSPTPNYKASEESFIKLTELSKDWATGYIWKARAKLKQEVDPAKPTWLAKADYELYITKVLEADKVAQKSNLTEANRYLAIHYQSMNDTAKATEYFTKVKELDPNDPAMKAFFKIK